MLDQLETLYRSRLPEFRRVAAGIAGDRELGGLHHVAVSQTLQTCVAKAELRGGIEKVGQANVPEVHETNETAVRGIRL